MMPFNKIKAQKLLDSLGYYSQLVYAIKSDSDLQKSYQFFNSHLNASKYKKDKLGQAYALSYLSIIDFKIGFYDQSENTAVNALDILDQVKPTSYSTSLKKTIYNHLGKIYKEKGINDKAIINYKKALSISNTSKDSLVIYNNLSIVYKNNFQLLESKNILLEATSFFKRVKDVKEKSRVLDNLGFIKHKLNEADALLYLNEALSYRKQLKDSSDLYPSYRNLSKYYWDLNDTTKSKLFALKALNIANLIKSPSYQLDATKRLMQLGDFSVYNKYITLNDSLEHVKKTSQNKFAQLKYDVNKSELQSQQEKTKKQLYQFLAIIILIIALATYLLLIIKHKKDRLKQVYLTESRISKKVHDEVANDIYQIMNKIQDSKNSKLVVLDDLEHVYNKTRDISKENSLIEFKENFSETLSDLLLSYQNNNTNIITQNLSNIDWSRMSNIKKNAIYRVLQELMTNMKKHSQATLVVIIFNQAQNKIEIKYSDNGIGCDIKKNNGLQNAETVLIL
ncbi:hypothetical protein C7H62_2228 [Mesoflavibacter sp. HG96]|nr:hypothetical protein C7H62_2228 [Mesoflavibacter sp. HG96]QIJ92764.1 hypothetical protein C7H56_2228 [Mesoflavibacter sp. HG37]